jgi:hypothetical protein
LIPPFLACLGNRFSGSAWRECDAEERRAVLF